MNQFACALTKNAYYKVKAEYERLCSLYLEQENPEELKKIVENKKTYLEEDLFVSTLKDCVLFDGISLEYPVDEIFCQALKTVEDKEYLYLTIVNEEVHVSGKFMKNPFHIKVKDILCFEDKEYEKHFCLALNDNGYNTLKKANLELLDKNSDNKGAKELAAILDKKKTQNNEIYIHGLTSFSRNERINNLLALVKNLPEPDYLFILVDKGYSIWGGLYQSKKKLSIEKQLDFIHSNEFNLDEDAPMNSLS